MISKFYFYFTFPKGLEARAWYEFRFIISYAGRDTCLVNGEFGVYVAS